MKSIRTRSNFLAAMALSLWAMAGGVWADDPGQERIGTLKTELIFATNESAEHLGGSAKPLGEKEKERLETSLRKNYKFYRKLGVDRERILRGYENWSSPMTGSEVIMVSFEPKGRVGTDALRLEMELWQSKQKVLKTDSVLRMGKQLCIVGPKWRDGQLIIVLELVELLPE